MGGCWVWEARVGRREEGKGREGNNGTGEVTEVG